jgi:hypothetical protein
VAFAPALAALFFIESPVLALVLAVLGLLYYPAALIVSAHDRGFGAALNPMPGFALIRQLPGPYAVTLAYLGLTLAVSAALVALISLIPSVPLEVLFFVTVTNYAPTVCVRMLGLLISEYREEL